MNTRSLVLKLAHIFPKSIAKRHHDFVGVMIGPLPKNTDKILLCLDLDEEVMEVVRKTKPNLIITHHPFLYGSKIRLLKSDEKKTKIFDELTKLGISVYSIHTNFDAAKGGMNDALANLLKLKNVYAPAEEPMMRIGEMETMLSVVDFSKYAIEKLNLDYALLIGNRDKIIKKVAIVGGGGGRINYLDIARLYNADIYISGDAPHYVRRNVVNNNYTYLDVMHEVERVFMPVMERILKSIDETLEIVTVDHEEVPLLIQTK